jgi:hypothetical protein
MRDRHFTCDICGGPGVKMVPNQVRHQGECAAVAKRKNASRALARKMRRTA